MYKFSEVDFLEIKEDSKYLELIEKVIRQAFIEEKIDNINLYINVILTNPENIRKINKQYRNIDKETDVLSFPMFEKEELVDFQSNCQEVLGDIIISIDRVKEQAEEYGHSFQRELSYMVVHGFYHLMGYDHMEEQDKIQMRAKEEEVLSVLKIEDKKEKAKQKQILFLKNDLKQLDKSSLVVKDIKQKLVELGAMKQIKNCYKTIEGHYKKQKEGK